jgi:hypothetical protein
LTSNVTAGELAVGGSDESAGGMPPHVAAGGSLQMSFDGSCSVMFLPTD